MPDTEILFEDDEYVFAVKPVGVLSESDGSGGMVDILKAKCRSEIYPVHRLDRAVGGVMVYAKSQRSAAYLSKLVSERAMTKEYLAVVRGDAPGGVMEDLLFKDSARNKSYVVKRERCGVKKASLEYEAIEHKDGRTLVKIRLHTGRSHQIRVQFSSRGMPLIGDGKYGAGDNSCTVALWSLGVSFRKDGKDCGAQRLPEREYPWDAFDLGAALKV